MPPVWGFCARPASSQPETGGESPPGRRTPTASRRPVLTPRQGSGHAPPGGSPPPPRWLPSLPPPAASSRLLPGRPNPSADPPSRPGRPWFAPLPAAGQVSRQRPIRAAASQGRCSITCAIGCGWCAFPIACMSRASAHWGTSASMPSLMANPACSISWLPLSPSWLPARPSSSWRWSSWSSSCPPPRPWPCGSPSLRACHCGLQPSGLEISCMSVQRAQKKALAALRQQLAGEG